MILMQGYPGLHKQEIVLLSLYPTNLYCYFQMICVLPLSAHGGTEAIGPACFRQ